MRPRSGSFAQLPGPNRDVLRTVVSASNFHYATFRLITTDRSIGHHPLASHVQPIHQSDLPMTIGLALTYARSDCVDTRFSSTTSDHPARQEALEVSAETCRRRVEQARHSQNISILNGQRHKNRACQRRPEHPQRASRNATPRRLIYIDMRQLAHASSLYPWSSTCHAARAPHRWFKARPDSHSTPAEESVRRRPLERFGDETPLANTCSVDPRDLHNS